MTINLTNFKNADHTKVSIQSEGLRTPAPYNFYRDTMKPLLDKTVIIVTAPLVLPIILLLALLVSLDGHNPFYSQMRVGKNGKHFRLWKLRTMVPDAYDRLDDYLAGNAAARQEWNATQKLKNDPRITTVGNLLRRTSLDELPQLLNVLLGSMSLVGPRPMMVNQKALYPGQAYFQLSPGITGLWQISDRNNCDFIGRVSFDETYGKTVSFKTDVGILFNTVAVVLRGTGC